ncbi:MAG: M20/M25/M40 family metallo-hydrolase [Candidatus Omnitrophica bacterium]|nr:M20/M25/M40 family metallo-hydrolase [Candidatus Omnitrophota bacterium]
MKRIAVLLVLAGGMLLLGKLSTFGWRFCGARQMNGEYGNTLLSQRLKRHVMVLSDEIGDRSVFRYDRLLQAQEYLKDQLVSYGYEVKLQTYRARGKEVSNVIAVNTGRKEPETIVLVGAHYDSCMNPGADDNASAVAGVLEIARALADQVTNKTVQFVLFVNEEPPFFHTEMMGSRVYTRTAKARGEAIEAALVLEMIGYYTDQPGSQRYPPALGMFYPNSGNFIAVVSNFSSGRIKNRVVSLFRKHSEFPLESISAPGFVSGIDFSDHWSFWQEGYPAVMITDTAFYRNPHYHRLTDTWQTLDYTRTAEVVRGLTETVTDLAGSF